MQTQTLADTLDDMTTALAAIRHGDPEPYAAVLVGRG